MVRPVTKRRRRFKESNILFQSDVANAITAAVHTIEAHREQLESYVVSHPEFQSSLFPVAIDDAAPIIVKMMDESTRPLQLGPMAAVAGALADLAVQSMLDFDVSVAIVENGGEVSVYSTVEAVNVGLYAGQTKISDTIGFQITSQDCPIGIGTSSGTVGHAFSFGKADAATVFADNAALADAAATAVCNVVRGDDIKESVHRGLELANQISCVHGALIVRGDYIGSVGKIPKFIKITDP